MVNCPALTSAAHRKADGGLPPTAVTCVLGMPPVQLIVRSMERSIGAVTLGILVHAKGVEGTSIDAVKAPTSFPPVPVRVKWPGSKKLPGVVLPKFTPK